jgi:hypothetical protein
MSETQIKVDIGQALARTRTLMFLDKAAKKQATDWLTVLVRSTKRAAQNMKKSWNKTGHMADNVGMSISPDGKTMAAGTGIGGMKNVVYASVQDNLFKQEIKPKGKYLAIPFKGIYGTPRNFPNTFVRRARSGNLIMMQKIKGEKPINLFTLVRSVNITGTGWFTLTKDRLMPELADAMSEEMILTRAVIMAGK